jgi:putative spermidine/putrescine transport system substrate-binding protein
VGPNILWSWVTAYREDSFRGDAPQTIADFFDLERFPGRRAISVFPQANLEMALVADGVPPDEVYAVLDTEGGVERALAKLSTLGADPAFWSSGEEPVDLLQSGEVVMSTAYNGRIGAAVMRGDGSLRTIWDGQVVEEEWLVIPKGTPHLETATAFLRHAAQPMQQAIQAKWITYGPMRRSALEIIAEGEPWFHTGAEVLPHLPTTTQRMNRSVISDPDWWAEHGDEMTERFAAWRRSLGY